MINRILISVALASATVLAQQPGEITDVADKAPMRTASTDTQVGKLIVPAGAQIPLRLKQAISTKNAKPGDAVYAETTFPFTQNDRIVIPAGTYVQGRISSVRRPGRVKGRAEVLMHFTSMIFPNGYTALLPGGVENMPGSDTKHVKDSEGTVQQNPEKGKDVEKAASTATTGAIIGAIAGGGKGAGIGAGAGGAAGLAIAMLTRGSDILLPEGTSVQMVLQRPLILDEAKLRR